MAGRLATGHISKEKVDPRGVKLRSWLKVREQMLLLAKKYNAAFWDMFQVMGGLGSIYQWQQAGLAKKDKIHLTTEGYKLMGDLMFSAILKKYENHIKHTAQ